MEKIKIFHAYNGFIYSPLYVADKIGLFPKNLELVYTASDLGAIEQLCSQDSSKGEIHFAICDPFAANFDSITPEHSNDEIYIIGSLINKIPFWVYNTNPEIKPVKKESDLSQYKKLIKNVITYEENTTGYIIGKRISKAIDRPIKPVKFGEEFNEDSNKNLIITADVLRMVDNGLNHKNVIFPYPTRAPKEINPFLFTSILTLKENINKQLWAVLNVLAVIQLSISHLSDAILHNDLKLYLQQIFSQHTSIISKLNSKQQGDCDKLITETCNYIFINQKLYDGFPKLDTDNWEIAWNNAKNEWQKVYEDNKYPDVEKVREPIPALLIKQNWKFKLMNYIKQYISNEDSMSVKAIIPVKNLIPKHQYYLTVLMIILGLGCGFLNIYCGFVTYYPAIQPEFIKFFYLLSIDTLLLSIAARWAYVVTFKKFDFSENSQFNLALTVFVALLGGAITLLVMLL